ncbi:MAG: hypothetical protein ACLQBJ_01070 [Bryobacteraceae bacterium]
MTRLVVLAALAAVPLAALPAADDLTPDQQQEIIRKFAAKEAAFAHARENYTYRQRYMIETLGPGGRPDGKHEEVSDVVFTPDGQRTERTVYAPMDTLERIQMDAQDVQDLRSIQPFVLTTKDIDKYEIHYLGRDQVDEITCYLFAVKPKQMLEGERYFAGQIWVDDRDLQIVKTYGRGVGLQKRNSDHKWPKFETYREQIDGKYWFPTYTVSNDVLNFRNESVPIKMLITYKDYKQFKSESTITYEDVGGDPNKKPQAPPKQ